MVINYYIPYWTPPRKVSWLWANLFIIITIFPKFIFFICCSSKLQTLRSGVVCNASEHWAHTEKSFLLKIKIPILNTFFKIGYNSFIFFLIYIVSTLNGISFKVQPFIQDWFNESVILISNNWVDLGEVESYATK